MASSSQRSSTSRSARSGSSKLKHEDIESLNATLRESLGDRYEVTAQLGSGAFGEVYKAQDTLLDRAVAIKRIRLDRITDPANREEARARFLREAKVAAQLNHPNIVTIHDIVDKPEVSFIVMELVDGPTLEDELNRKKRLSLEETLEMLSQAADGLDYAHKNTVVHRDVKPANIMIESSGRVKVADFGLAKSETSSNITSAGLIVGTPNYMSPEQARADAEVGTPSDVFSLGAIVYECLSGERPFRADSTVATLLRIVKDETPKLDCAGLGLPSGLSDVLERAMAKVPAERFASAGDFMRALASVGRGEPTDSAEAKAPEKVLQVDPDMCGQLAKTPLAEVIRDIYAQRKTGVLRLERDEVEKRIYFKKGSIVFANSDVNDERLGEFLIRHGEIDRSAFDEAARLMKETGERLGTTLVDLGHLNEETMKNMVARQFEAIVHSLFEWDSGQYGFASLEDFQEEDIVVRLSTAETILEGVRRMSSPEKIRSALGDLERVLVHSENPLLLYQKVSLTSEEGFILSRIDGVTTVAEAAVLSPLGEEKTLQYIYGLVSAGILEIQESGGRTSRLEKAPELEVPKPDVDVRKEEDRQRESTPTRKEKKLREDIAAKHASLATATFYELLEVSPTAGGAEIKTAYYALVKKYHPDRHHSPHLKKMRGLLEELLGKITAAYEVLKVPAERERYDSRILGRRSPVSTSGVAAPSERLESKTESRANPKELAEKHFKEGQRRYNDMAYFDAIQCFREATRLDPKKGRYHRYLALSLAQNPKWKKEAEEHFQTAIGLDAFDVESYQGLVEIYEAMGMKTRLQKTCEKLLEVDPENALAREKLRGNKTGKKLKGLFKKKQ